jgi:hypothetical protein
MIAKFAPTALNRVAPGAGTAMEATRLFFKAEQALGAYQPIVAAGPNSPAGEVQQAHDVAKMTGNDIVMVDNPTNQGFDALQIKGGFMDPQRVIPTEFKNLTSSNPQSILTETVATEKAANGVTLPNGDPLTGVQIYVNAPNMTAGAVANFANGGPLPQIAGWSSVQSVTVTTSNGTVTIQNKQVTVKCNGSGTCSQ